MSRLRPTRLFSVPPCLPGFSTCTTSGCSGRRFSHRRQLSAATRRARSIGGSTGVTQRTVPGDQQQCANGDRSHAALTRCPLPMSCMPGRAAAGDAELGRPGRRIGSLAFHQRVEVELAAEVGLGNRGEQRARIGVHRVAEQLRRGRELDDASGAHHRDAVGEVVHHREVVRDEEVGEAERLAQVGKQVEHLRLHRDVERRDRLVADQQLRAERERARDADPLALPAREAVRVAPQVAHVEAHQPHHLLHAREALVLVADAVDHQRLAHDVVRGHARVERAEGVLEHELDLAPVGEQLRRP